METRNIFSDPGKCGNLIEFQSNETMSHFMASFPDNTFWNVNRNVTSGNSTNQGGQSTYLYEQPIDLRISHNDQQRKEDFIDAYYSRSCTKAEGHPKESSSVNTYQQQASQICLDYKKKRRGMSKINPIVLDGDNIAYPASFSPEKQAEIMKAACSLFSKRTRTLYQWMYPNVTKQQVKIAVANYWQSLGQSEKDFYVSQVLGRFGFRTSNLMVNPQLHTMKELPPEPPKPLLVNQPKRNTSELQKAISSISVPQNSKPLLSINNYGVIKNIPKRKRSGQKGGNTKKKFVILASSEDFQDDPELSQELEKFAIKFNFSNVQ